MEIVRNSLAWMEMDENKLPNNGADFVKNVNSFNFLKFGQDS